MKQLLSFVLFFISGIALAQDRFLDQHNFGALKVSQVNKWFIYYKNGEKTDSTLYVFEYDSTGKMVAEKWNFSSDLRNYTQSRNGEILNQDGEPGLSGNPPLNGYDEPFLFNTHKAFGIQKTKQWYTMAGDIRTIEIWHQVNENAHGIMLTHKWRSKIEF